jgi:hypothetical protein
VLGLCFGILGCGRNLPDRPGEVELAIGGTTDEDPGSIRLVSGIATDAQGRIWATDALSDDIRVFNADGTFAFRIGGTGADSTQFAGPCCLSFDERGRLWVRDGANARYSVFSTNESGVDFLFSVPSLRGAQTLRRPITFDPQGRLIDVRQSSTRAAGGAVRMFIDSLGVAQDSQVLAPVPQESLGVIALQSNGAIWFLKPPYGAVELIAHGPQGDYARAISSRYLVRRHSVNGDVLYEISRPRERGPALTHVERARAENQLIKDAQRMGMAPAELAGLMPFRNQVLAGLYFDRGGRLWVELHTRLAEPNRVADVYDREGNGLFRAEWPKSVDLAEIAWISEDMALGVEVDTLPGYDRVMRVRWR